MVLLIDNYDSFVYNLFQYIGELGLEPVVFRNDGITVEEIEKLSPSHIIISPGPKTPMEAGISNEVIKRFAGRVPILGVCLGHQCIGYVFGGKVGKAKVPFHGKQSLIYHDGRSIYSGIPSPILAGRYHSLVIKREGFPRELDITAETEDGEIMGVRHKKFVIEGVQFHPESILTETGYDLISNFLKIDKPFWGDSYGGDLL